MKIGLDLDDTVFSFMPYYIARFGEPKCSKEITRNVTQILQYDRDFWLNQPILRKPNFDVTLYCTKRVHNKEWTKKQLEIHELPKAPIYQILIQNANKADRIKNKVDVFVDDSVSNMIQMNLSGVPCLLIDAPHNQSWGAVGRIYSLDKDEIEDAYQLLIDTVFDNFKELL